MLHFDHFFDLLIEQVHDYVRSYLGETPEAMDFSKNFLEKRSKFKNQAKQAAQQDEVEIF